MRYAPPNITSRLLTNNLLTIILLCIIATAGCTKDKPVYPVPTIKFVTLPGLTSTDTTLMLNDTVRIGISAKTGSDQALTHFHMTVIKDSAITYIDSALYTNQLENFRTIIKGIAKKETRIFYVRDRDGRKSQELTITFSLDSSSMYGDISYILSIRLGAQKNTSTGSFYSLSAKNIYTKADAFTNQGLINLLYYFDTIDADKNTIASPGANVDASVFPGTTGITNWAIRNTTRFKIQQNITTNQFELCRNDSLILSNTFEFESGFRKAKNLVSGQIYSFVTDSGLKGLFKVLEVSGETEGDIAIAIKIKK